MKPSTISQKWINAGAIVIPIAVLLGAGFIGSWTSGPKTLTDQDFEYYAKTACEKEVRATLHDPDSAQFPSRDSFKVTVNKPRQSYAVIVDIRAKNAFNALRSVTYSCLITDIYMPKDGGVKWKGLAIQTS